MFRFTVRCGTWRKSGEHNPYLAGPRRHKRPEAWKEATLHSKGNFIKIFEWMNKEKLDLLQISVNKTFKSTLGGSWPLRFMGNPWAILKDLSLWKSHRIKFVAFYMKLRRQKGETMLRNVLLNCLLTRVNNLEKNISTWLSKLAWLIFISHLNLHYSKIIWICFKNLSSAHVKEKNP